MADAKLVDRLAALETLAKIPRSELEWLAEHGRFQVCEAGEKIAPKGRRIHTLWILLSGHMAIHVDRGVGPRMVMEWHTGDVSGMLPYSRMTGPPGDNFVVVRSELLTIHEDHFPDMIHCCPVFTAYTVHLMLDRARNFNASDLHDEKMVSLGKLSAGLAHELNNPASATARGAKLLLNALNEADAASRAIGAAGLSDELFEKIEQVRAASEVPAGVLSPIEQADREDRITEWLLAHDCDPGHAVPLAGTSVTFQQLDELAAATEGAARDAALRWISAGCATHSLANDIDKAATRISELVGAIKRFTYMDNLTRADAVDVGAGLRDTIRVLESKAKEKGAGIVLDVAESLPPVRATGGELNQVWINLIDNALDAIGEGGSIAIRARRELDRVVVSVIDDGPGIPPKIKAHIFDPFYTTKSPGQGTGLGLDITRRLIRRYHGDITVQSEPGCTEFRVSLLADDAGEKGDASPS